MHILSPKWKQPAILTVAHLVPPRPVKSGTVAELITIAMEELTERERRFVHIQFGNTILGAEAIDHAYRAGDFPLQRKEAPERPYTLFSAKYFSSQ